MYLRVLYFHKKFLLKFTLIHVFIAQRNLLSGRNSYIIQLLSDSLVRGAKCRQFIITSDDAISKPIEEVVTKSVVLLT